jgi:hypothetical protein
MRGGDTEGVQGYLAHKDPIFSKRPPSVPWILYCISETFGIASENTRSCTPKNRLESALLVQHPCTCSESTLEAS